MNDVMKKRLIGVAVLVAIGVLAPLLLSKCMHSGDDDNDRSSMRVYNVEPNGSTQSVSSSTDNTSEQSQPGDGSTGSDQSASREEPPKPEAISPQSQPDRSSENSSFSTPSVQGSENSNLSQTSPPDSGSGNSESTPPPQAQAQLEPKPEPKPEPKQQSSGTESSGSSRKSDNGSKAQRNDSASGWVVQIASFGDKSNAEAMVNKLSGQYRASYAGARINGKTWYRVNVGPFASEDAARATAASLRKQGQSPLVRHLP